MKKVVVWGAGDTAVDFLKYFDFQENQIVAFVDNDPSKVGTFFPKRQIIPYDVEIVSANELQTKIEYDVIVICSMYEQEILSQCRQMNLQGEFLSHADITKIGSLYRENYWLEIIQEKIENNTRANDELLWKATFSDTVEGYNWWKKTSLSLGRWAIGYNYAYVMCRVLNDFKPKKILELGLGQSSKIINNYASYYENITYEVVEHDSDWIKFFSHEHELSQMNIYQRNLVKTVGQDVVYRYDDIESVIKGKKYNFISIDAPFGGDSILSRVDLLPYITDILDDEFVIMIDDYERIGEKNMSEKLMQALKDANINFFRGKYRGAKDILIIVSEKWKFLTTL